VVAGTSPELQTIVIQTLGQMGKAAQPALTKLSALVSAEQLKAPVTLYLIPVALDPY
jgi:hypothetical protein